MGFAELRQELRDRREFAERIRRDTAKARDRFDRVRANPNATKAELDAAESVWRAIRNDAAAARDREIAAAQAFGAAADPRSTSEELKDQFPILMFPVRIETRYAPGPARELLVRIYPDDCLIDSFEPALSEDEVKSARLYWQARWAAGNVVEQQRGAWRLLAGNLPPGRAEWIADTYKPLNPAEEPQKKTPGDIFLIITTPGPLPAEEERAQLAQYWTAVWREHASSAEAIRREMESAFGAERTSALLAWVPFNLDETPAPPMTKAQAPVQVHFLWLAEPAALSLRYHSWSSAARSYLLPERFVFLGFGPGSIAPVIQVIGEPVLAPLAVGPDPAAPEGEQLQQAPDGTLLFPRDMQWMVDFEQAVAVGMGIRVPLADLPTPNFDRVIVAGIRLVSDQDAGKKELESLLSHHRYSRSGLAVLPQGTPTNNTDEQGAGSSRTHDSDVSFDDRRHGRLWDATAAFRDKAGGQWLTELLGIDEPVFTMAHESGRRDQAEARAMNAALWPATLGFWMRDLNRDVFDAATIEWTRGFFTGCVFGRGSLPALRIGEQPYGILPATPYSRSGWFSVGDPELDRVGKLWSILETLMHDWQAALVPRVSYVGKPGNQHQILLDVLGLHSGSVAFSQRRNDGLFARRQPVAADQWWNAADRLARRFGHAKPARPFSASYAFFMSPDTPLPSLIDDRPLSETAPVRAYTNDEKNYIHWLAKAGSREALTKEEGFKEKPAALLYRVLKRALEYGYDDTSPGAEKRLQAQIAALERLEDLPTARLERIFTEHLDCCAYRADAWVQGVLLRQLVRMRMMDDTAAGSLKGIHLGAYAVVEHLHPDPRNLTSVTITDPDIIKDFDAVRHPLFTDVTNEGYIHAPSLNQAIAAAVLRNGYISNSDKTSPDTFAVNLTSDRVRTALSILEGIRGGQSLGALLGYQFERGLHDRHTVAGIDQYILSIRREFPLGSNRMKSTRTNATDVAIDTIEARNVVDGVAMLNHVRLAGSPTYPFPGTTHLLDRRNPAENAAITQAVVTLLATYDAVADLAMSEGVYQAVMGNYDRLGATLDSLGQGTFPPEPQIVNTPSEGTGLTHRVGIHLKAGLNPDTSPVSGVAPTPRSLAEPAVNAWIASLLPPLDQIGCMVRYRDRAGAEQKKEITLAQLKLQPADVVALLRDASEATATELDERITALVAGEARPDAPVTIAYLEKDHASFSLFELMPLVRHLRRLLRAARPLKPTDLARPNDGRSSQDAATRIDKSRVEKALAVLNGRDGVRAALAGFVAPIAALLQDPAAHRDEIRANGDAWIAALPGQLGRAALFGIPQCGWSFAYEFRRRLFAGVRAKAAEVIDRWTRKLADYNAFIAKFNALPGTATDAERFAVLTAAEGAVTTSVTTPLPATVADHKAAVAVKAGAFEARLAQFVALRKSERLPVKELLADFEALLPLKPFDLTDVHTKDETAQCVTFAEDVVRVVNVVIAEADKRIDATKSLLDQNDATGAAKALLGEEFVIVPEFSLTAEQGAQVAAAVAASASLLSYAATKLELPVDSWLYGVARVRERMRDWEQLVMFAGALGRPEPELTPLQFPVIDKDSWMAVDFPSTVRRDVERLLYTAHFAEPFDKTKPQCGLLVDEWTEVIPASTATTGIAMHYDRPDNEAPQSMLLLTPALTQGAWHWKDIYEAIYETFDLAKLRAVEPRHIDNTVYGVFLPALVLQEWEDQPG